jgi:hypothetical protein
MQDTSEQENFHTVLGATRETETMKENNQDWLQLDEWGPEFSL